MGNNETLAPRGFWQFNIGHVGSLIVSVFFMGCAWQSIANHLEKQDQAQTYFQGEISAIQEEAKSLTAEQQNLQQVVVTDHQDSIDLHKTIENDYERRLAKLEDALNRH